MKRLVLAIAFLPVMATLAWAQTDAHPVAETLLAQLMPFIVAGIGALLTALFALGVKFLNRIDAKWAADALQASSERATKALTNAAGGLIQKYGAEAAMKFDVSHPAVAAAAGEVLLRIPGALKALNITPESISQRILEKVPIILPVDGGGPVAIAVAPPGETGPAGPKGAPGAPGKPGS